MMGGRRMRGRVGLCYMRFVCGGCRLGRGLMWGEAEGQEGRGGLGVRGKGGGRGICVGTVLGVLSVCECR